MAIKNQHTFKKSGLGEAAKRFKKPTVSRKKTTISSAARKTKTSIRFNPDQKKIISLMRSKIQSIASDPAQVKDVSVLRGLLYWAQDQPPFDIWVAIKRVKRFKSSDTSFTALSPVTLPLTLDHRGILEKIIREVSEYSDRKEISIAALFKGLIILAKDEEPETLLAYLQKTTF